MTETRLSLVMSGKRRPGADEADGIRRFFGYHLPDDPNDGDAARIERLVAKLDASRRRAVVPYLEALVDIDQEPPEAS